MVDVLDQSEVDALLAAVDTGEVQESAQQLTIFSRTRKNLEGVEVRPYDFKRPERVSKDQMRAIQTLHESFARNFGASLSGFLRTIVEVKVSNCEQMTYSEFIAGLPNPTSFNLLTAEPLEGRVCLEVSPLIIYPIIDRLLGGTNSELFIPQRPLTVIETRLISKVIDRALDGLKDAWDGVKTLDFKLTDSESNPQLVLIVAPNEVVVVIGFELKMANRAGTMNICYPYAVIEPIIGALSSQSWFTSGKQTANKESAKHVAGQLTRAALSVTGLLAETTITLRDLMNLEVGDLIATEKPANQPVVLCVEGEKKLLATVGQIKGSKALKVLRPVTAKDRV
ncbi:MAG: flagellar motor switch protein FliM [Planctomycetes bacterium]|nr:flagellar motor switch protein FliM [Planctomycetota bacterium]